MSANSFVLVASIEDGDAHCAILSGTALVTSEAAWLVGSGTGSQTRPFKLFYGAGHPCPQCGQWLSPVWLSRQNGIDAPSLPEVTCLPKEWSSECDGCVGYTAQGGWGFCADHDISRGMSVILRKCVLFACIGGFTCTVTNLCSSTCLQFSARPL